MQQPEAAAAEAGTERLDHAQRGADGDGRVKGVAALLQHFHPGLCRQRMGAGYGMSRRLFGMGRGEPEQQDGEQAGFAGVAKSIVHGK